MYAYVSVCVFIFSVSLYICDSINALFLKKIYIIDNTDIKFGK